MFLDRLIDFLGNLSPLELLYYFWPFFVIDFTRYVLLDALVLGYRFSRRNGRGGRRSRARKELFRSRPLVSVIAPGRNEGKHIPTLVESLSRQTYRNFELVVVDDGSDDATPALCRSLAAQGKIHRFVRNQPRGGKASAANTALLYAKGEYIVHLDADSSLRHDALERILLPFFMSKNVGAVGGDIRAANAERSLATRCQAFEYLKALSIGRAASSALHLLRIVAGAYGAFPREVLERLGGWDVGPGLDGDLTLKVRKLGYRVVHEPEAVCYTSVPTTFRALARQRYRWDRSMVRFRMRKHADMFNPMWSSRRWANFASSFENVFFTMGLNAKWWVYFAQMILLHPGLVQYLIVINYVLYVVANAIQLLVAVVVLGPTLRPVERRLWTILPVIPMYTGVYLRLVRTYAHLMELRYRASYLDAWNPWKVSRVARAESL